MTNQESDLKHEDKAMAITIKKDGRTIRKVLLFRTFFLFFVILLSLATTFFALLYSPAFSSDADRFVEKSPIKKRLTTVIKNGGTLEIVKHVFEVRELKKPRIFKEMDSASFYSDITPLSVILNDLCVDYMEADPFRADTTYYSRLMDLIKENQYHNPFDNLEATQISFFENLKVKSGDDYDLIESDVAKIATELSHKNQLVSKYLNKSNVSFVISIVAICITIIMSLVQIIQSSKVNARMVVLQGQLEDKSKRDVEAEVGER